MAWGQNQQENASGHLGHYMDEARWRIFPKGTMLAGSARAKAHPPANLTQEEAEAQIVALFDAWNEGVDDQILFGTAALGPANSHGNKRRPLSSKPWPPMCCSP